MLRQWLIDEYGVELDAECAGLDGGALADAVHRVLVRGGFDYDRQRAVLLAAAGRHHDIAFGEACLDRVERIAAFQRRLADTPAPTAAKPQRRNSAVIARADRPPAKTYADLRFSASRPGVADMVDVVADFCRHLVEQGYAENRPDVERDLRQGFGYYRRSEDPMRQRRTVRWLHRQNELRYIILRLVKDTDPICKCDGGAGDIWIVTASLFADAQGRAFSNKNFDHGDVGNPAVCRALDALIPRLPPSHQPATK